MIDDEESQGIKKVHFRDSFSQHPIVTYKRRRQQKPQTQQQLRQPPPSLQQHPEPQLQVKLEPKTEDVPEQQFPILRARDIGWEHAVDLDGNKRRWQCKFCSLCRSGGVTTLKAHLIDDSCPNVPKEISKKVSNFIEEKRATRLLLNNYVFNVDEDFNTILQEGTVEYVNEQQPSRKATYVQTLSKCAINEIAAGSKQCGAECSGQPVEHCDQPEEQCTMDYGRMDRLTSNKNQILDKNTENSKNTKMLKPCRKSEFNTRKHIIIVDKIGRHWKCRYCGMDVYGKKFQLHYHLAGAFRQAKCPNVPREVFAKARQHVLTKKMLKKSKAEQQIPSSPHILAQSGEERQNNDPFCGNQSQLSINNEPREVHNYPAVLRDSAWEHSLIYEKENGHWKCKWCSIEGDHGLTRLMWHLVGWQNRPQCPNIPKDVAEKMKDQMMSKKEQKARSGLFDGNGCCEVLCSSNSSQLDQNHLTARIHDRCSSQAFDHANSELKGCNMLSNTILSQQSSNPQVHHEDPQVCHEQERKEVATSSEPGCEQGQRMQWQSQNKPMMEGPHDNGLCGDTNQLEEQKSGFGISDCWRYVLDGQMHLPDVQEGAGIGTCIRDALLYGCAEFGTVPDKMEMDCDKTVDANTAKCQNILKDVLRSENFALLCSVLCRTVHQDGERTRYFDFGVIDSRMKNGNYGPEPELFVHDLKLLWEDLKVAGQDIVHLANNLSSLTEDSYEKLVGRERGSDDDELNEAVVARDSICNRCGKVAGAGSVLKCYRCMLPCHISCIEATGSPISTGRWCCKNCSAGTKEPVEGDMVLAHGNPNCLHESCVVCDRLAACRSPKCDNSRALVISSVDPEIDTCYSCKICGGTEEDEKRFLICGNVLCRYMYYHIGCLKSMQISTSVERGSPCWYCPSCLCRVCLCDKDDDLTILCDGCDEAYHIYCITPRHTSIPKGQWYCSSCSVERAEEGMRQYERRTLKLHRKEDAGLQSWNFDGVDLLLSAAEQLRIDEQLETRTD
ncbi:RING/FYVE/PHD-type zinc finger family protein [Zea mays]|uniref:RING/FYVE/PHD-type zinc finger family protein n=1 Tax=Zea mays TaxID=4577 RepID=A0A1D6FXG0_MAIZE|nr:RING/FYVE/PHD-type zinc finger family protein [Zea mays]